MLPLKFLEIVYCLMLLNSHSFKLFFIILLFPIFSNTQNIPKPIPKPEIVEKKYDDLFKQIKKQNWQVAKAIANDYQDNTLVKYVEWLDITRPGSKHDFDYLVNFINTNSNWPNSKEIKRKIESSITKTTNSKKVLNWFEKNNPLTVQGSINYFEHKLKLGITEDKVESIRDIWINKNLTFKQQKYFIRKYSKYWTNDDNWKRFDRLMWEGKTVSARRTLQRIKGDLRKLGNARLALSSRAGNVTSLINKVPNHLINDPGLIYERMRWRRKAKLDSAEDFLFSPPKNIENYRNWWINARIVIRRLINKKKYSKAYKLLSNHSIPVNTISGAEAEWMSGWIALTFLNKTNQAIDHFGVLFNEVTHPSSKAKAAYWMAYSMEKAGKSKVDYEKWYEISSKHYFSFYGQNALMKINKFSFDKKNVEVRKPKCCEELFKVINFLIEANENRRLFPFLNEILNQTKSDEEKNYVFKLTSKLKNQNFLVKLVKKESVYSFLFSYPRLDNYVPLKFRKQNDMALIHAIILQESAFQVDAYSHAGARGLMQLMPYTAKRVAKSIKVKYYKKSLRTNPEYNILLGATYIKQLLKNFDNSLPLALAGYNGGPGRVKIWLRRYGDPRKNEISYIDWIESIPISETRNYVKKVLANYRLYQNIYDSKKKNHGFIFMAKN